MAFPTVAGTSTGSAVPATSDFSPTLPTGVVTGNLLVAFVFQSATPAVSAPEGWTLLAAPVSNESYTFHAWARIATTDGALGNALNISRAAGSTDLAVGIYRISGWAGVSLSNVAAALQVTFSAGNPPALSPSWGAADTLWIAAVGSPGIGVTAPTNYAGNDQIVFNMGGALVGVAATRNLNASTEDPGIFGGPSTFGFGATVAVRPSVPALAFAGTVPTISGEKNAAMPAQSPAIASYFSGGTTPYSYALQSGTLPAGLSLNVATGAIVGTPTATGTFAITIRATDAASATADTTAPVLSSPTAAQTGAGTASGSVSTTEPRGTLYRLASTNATETAATVKAAALTQTVTATGTQDVTFTGLSSGTYFAHFVQTDADGNDSSRVSSSSFVMSSDGTPPSWGAATLASSIVTTTSFTVTASGAATDNVAVTGYETSFDGGATYTTNSPATSFSRAYTGGTAGATVEVRMRAFDAAGNRSAALSLPVTLTNTTVNLGPFGTSGTLWPNGTAVLVNWLPGWRAGDAIPGGAVVRSATVVGTGGLVPLTGLPVGPGVAIVTKRETTVADDLVAMDVKTVV